MGHPEGALGVRIRGRVVVTLHGDDDGGELRELGLGSEHLGVAGGEPTASADDSMPAALEVDAGYTGGCIGTACEF